MVCKKNLPKKGGPRKLSCARKHWTTTRLMIICIKRFSLCVIGARAHSTRDPMKQLIVQFEPMIRTVVREVMEKAIAKHWSQVPSYSSDSDSHYTLCFLTKLDNSIHTFSTIKSEFGSSSIQVSMLDAHRRTVKTGPLASAKVKVVVLHGNFCTDARDTCATAEFEKSIVTRRNNNKEALLVGNLEFRLQSGVAPICNVHFSDISKWARGEKFRLGVKLIDDVGERVHEGISNPFKVKHLPREGLRKSTTPSLDDKVWKLDKVSKNGVVREELEKEGIKTVGQLLMFYQKDEAKIRKILRHNWKKTIEHAIKGTQCTNVSQAPVALLRHADNVHCTNLPNGVSVGGLDEMVQPINSSGRTNPYRRVTNSDTAIQNAWQIEVNNLAPPNAGNFYQGSAPSRPNPFNCLTEVIYNLDVDSNIQEPNPAEETYCQYKEIYDGLSKTLAGALLKHKCIKIVAAVKWRRFAKYSAARRACAAPVF